jgi:peptide-methionine (R)-S-oxide reductase
MLGMAWGELLRGSDLGRIGRDRDRRFRVRSAAATDASLRLLLSQRNPEAFPILLAHHPHDFDPAAAAGLPLTLSGHTHGGQIMLTETIGVGPARFRYWTGPYAHGDARLFVSNGLGSWFPLRVNAPAEITHLTLRCGPATAPSDLGKVEHTDAQWKELLTPIQYKVLRKKGTERSYSGAYWDNHESGMYVCAGCGLELFSSDTKFDSASGWPSFWAPVAADHVIVSKDNTHDMERNEVLCPRCGGHLGHVFTDGPQPTGLRYCMNSAALKFVKK